MHIVPSITMFLGSSTNDKLIFFILIILYQTKYKLNLFEILYYWHLKFSEAHIKYFNNNSEANEWNKCYTEYQITAD